MSPPQEQQSVPMQRNVSVSSKFNFWNRKEPAAASDNVSTLDALGRSSTTYSMDSRRTGTDQERRLHFFNGTVDKKALSSKEPLDLLMDLEIFFENTLKCVIQSNGSSTGEYKLRILKPRGVKIDNGKEPATTAAKTDSPVPGMKKSEVNDPRMNQIYSSFPVSLKSRITKFVSSFGSGSKGSNGSLNDTSSVISAKEMSGMEEELLFSVEIQKVKDMVGTYVVEFRRVKGDKWAFKRLYGSVIGDLPL
ncbi:hypothetical protein BDR26DRAFT_295224 [Obelidium mucronatum]|nr:hypothetical protein BDR26DRAFT_295224 [Obelidium mucronatum]